MNDNPWHVDDMARMQRGRIQEEMRQIRMEERALAARVKRPGMIARLWAGIWTWRNPVKRGRSRDSVRKRS